MRSLRPALIAQRARQVRRGAGLLALAAACTGSAFAQAPPAGGPGLRLSGFGTVGVASSDTSGEAWGFRRDILQTHHDGGTRVDTDTRLGLQVHYTIDAQWELVGQAVLRRQAHDTPPSHRVDWAFVSYRPTPQWQLRAGRLSPDIFLLADHRSVGFAYPWVRPNVEFYAWLPVYSMAGGDATHQWRIAEADWRARLFAGRSSDRMPNPQSPAGAPGPAPTDESSRVRANFLGGTLTREADGLTVKASLVWLRSRVQVGGDMSPLLTALDGLASLPLPPVGAEAAALRAKLPIDGLRVRYAALGLSYERGPWTWHAEVNRVVQRPTGDGTRHYWAGMSRRWQDLTLFATVGRVWSAGSPLEPPAQWAAVLAPLVGPMAAAQAQGLGIVTTEMLNLSRLDQRSVALGARWDFHPRMALKIQHDRVKVSNHGGFLWGNASGRPNRGDVTTMTVDFVF